MGALAFAELEVTCLEEEEEGAFFIIDLGVVESFDEDLEGLEVEVEGSGEGLRVEGAEDASEGFFLDFKRALLLGSSGVGGLEGS